MKIGHLGSGHMNRFALKNIKVREQWTIVPGNGSGDRFNNRIMVLNRGFVFLKRMIYIILEISIAKM